EKTAIQHEYDKLKKDELGVEQMLDSYRKSLQVLEARQPNEESFARMDEGVGSPQPTGPFRSKMIITGLLIGFALGIGLIYLLHRLDDRLDLAEDIEAELEEPVLGQVPQIDLKSVPDGRLLVSRLESHNMFAESIRGVRSAVMFGCKGEIKQAIIVTSAVPGDGKTTFTVNFAATLANAGKRVLLVDADLRRGNVHAYFGFARGPGLSEFLIGESHWSDVARESEVKGLEVISSGQLPPNPGELLLSDVMRQFIAEAREEYDHILFDCPPLTAIDDTFCLVNLC